MQNQIEESYIELYDGYVTKCCDECLSYGFHKTSCSSHPSSGLFFDGTVDDSEFINKIDHVCHDHQSLASDCGCLNPDSYCRECYGKKTYSVDSFHCRMCSW